MSTPKDEEIKVRVPSSMKLAVQRIAEERYTSESAIAREAILAYLVRHGIQLPAGSAKSSSGARANKKDRLAPVVDVIKKHHPPQGIPPKASK